MQKPFIIAIGASAGGLAALFEFFDNTLPDGVSYIITTHLYAHQKSSLVELIQRHSRILVQDVENNMPVLPNVIYVMPENQTMIMENGRLKLTLRDLSIKINRAIDMFFCSLAEDSNFQIIAVILSGYGEDGTKGVAALIKTGAFIIAQEPATAGQSSMPLSVISEGYANHVLRPSDMPLLISKHIEIQKPVIIV